MHCPENFEVSILDVQFLAWCLYKWKESKKNDIKDYSIRIYIQGTLMMYNKMRWIKDHFDMIENIDEIHAIGTPFNILNRYILPNCFVNRIVMTNPMLNTVGGDHQKTQIFPNTWKNPEVEISSPGYDVTKTDDSYRYFLRIRGNRHSGSAAVFPPAGHRIWDSSEPPLTISVNNRICPLTVFGKTLLRNTILTYVRNMMII